MLLPASYANGFAPRDGRPLYPELWRGCVGAWNPGLGVSGLTLRDQSGFQNNGTLTGGPTWAASGGKYSLSFDGSDDYVLVSSTLGIGTILGRPNSATMSGWIYKKTTGRQVLIGDWNSSGVGESFVLELAGEKVVCYVRCPDFNNVVGNTSVPLNQWIHLAVTFIVGDQTILYLNGVSDKSQATVGVGPLGTGSAISLARAGAYNGLYVNGQLDDIRIYNRALSPQEIRTLSTRRGIAYEMAPRRRSSSAVTTNRRRRIIIGGNR